MASYRDQYDRMRRWYERFSKLNSGRSHDISTENYVDEIYAFFLNAYHLKDWIKNDHALGQPVRKSVEKYVNQTNALALCADICNSLKHLKRTESNRSRQDPQFGRKEFAVGITVGGPTTIALKYEVETNSGGVDA